MRRAATILTMAAVGAAFLTAGAPGQNKNDALRQAGLSAEARAAILTLGDDVRTLDRSHRNYVEAAKELSDLYAKLSEKAREVGALAASAQRSPGAGQDGLFKAVREMQKMQESFNIQFLALQNQMQKENRHYTTVSNALKVKHDTAKAAINNIR